MLLSFDRHFNLVLADVEEVYQSTPTPQQQQQQAAAARAWAGGSPSVPPDWKTRRLRQLFVRGDSVIVVACMP